MSRVGHLRITRREFYALGGFSHSRLFRKATKTGAWMYFMDTSR